MSNFVTRKHSYPVRCEICHKSDKYNPVINKCSRCSTYKISYFVKKKNVIEKYKEYFPNTNPVIRTSKLIIGGFFCCFCSIVLLVSLQGITNRYIKGSLVSFIGFLPLWIIYFEMNLRAILLNLLELVLYSVLGIFIWGLMGFYCYGFLLFITLEQGLLAGSIIGAIIKTLYILLVKVETHEL